MPPLLATPIVNIVRKLPEDRISPRVATKSELREHSAVEDVVRVVHPLADPPHRAVEGGKQRLCRPGDDVVLSVEHLARIKVGFLAASVVIVCLKSMLDERNREFFETRRYRRRFGG